MQTMTGLDAALEYHLVNSLGWSDLRPLQREAVSPVRSGADCVLIAPTAGGKTEAAVFPLLSEMTGQAWQGLSVLYVTPLRALLNNLHPRIEAYGQWLGRRVGLWHGDIDQTQRRKIRADPPDILLTTPESLEAMLVSTVTDHRQMFGGVRTIVIDELHSFAGSDRGWHLLGVLSRLERISGRRIQRVGLSATVGNPEEIGRWMQGTTGRDLRVVADTPPPGAADPEVTLDYVGSVSNAAHVIAALHTGEKRLVFCESRRAAENLAFELRERKVTTFVSHSSLSAAERRDSEQAFAEARDCVIVATSTLELGIDIGDLDRVMQIDAPRTVSSFLQRLGRTGRRSGTLRNMLFLTTSPQALLQAAALLLLWRRGFVEPIAPPPHPRHLVAQQMLGLALQEGSFGRSRWPEWFAGAGGMMADADEVLRYLSDEEFLVSDGGLLSIGPRAEKEFGRRHFMDLLSSFTVDDELRVVAGNEAIGFVSPLSVLPGWQHQRDEVTPLLLNGRAWRIESVDWNRFEVLVSPASFKGDTKWESSLASLSFEMMRAQRDVLLGAEPDVVRSKRAEAKLPEIRADRMGQVDGETLVVERRGDNLVWWTWAGLRANETLRAAMGGLEGQSRNECLQFDHAVGLPGVHVDAIAAAVPETDPNMVNALKFSAALPDTMARKTVGERFADRAGATATVAGLPASGAIS